MTLTDGPVCGREKSCPTKLDKYNKSVMEKMEI